MSWDNFRNQKTTSLEVYLLLIPANGLGKIYVSAYVDCGCLIHDARSIYLKRIPFVSTIERRTISSRASQDLDLRCVGGGSESLHERFHFLLRIQEIYFFEGERIKHAFESGKKYRHMQGNKNVINHPSERSSVLRKFL